MYLKELVKVKCPFQAHSKPNARPSLTPQRTSATLRGQRRARRVRLIDVKGVGNTASGNSSLTRQQRGSRCPYRGTHEGTVGALNKTQINDQVRLERHMRLLKGLYTGKGLSLKLGTKGETVNELSIARDQGKKHKASDEGKT